METTKKDGIKESNQMKMLKEIRRRLQLAEKGEWHKLLSSHLEDYPRKTSKTRREEDTGEGSQRTRDLQNATSRAQQGNIRGACQALVGRGLAPNNHDTVAKVKNMIAMDVTTDEHKELEGARKEAIKLKSKVPEMATGALERRIRVLKAGVAPGSSGHRNNHIRAVAAAPGGLRADSVDCSVDKRETRTPRNESMERGDDRATRQRWNKSETDCPHGSTGKASARNADGKDTPEATKERGTEQNEN